MEPQKFSQAQYKIVYFISFIEHFAHIKMWDEKFLGNNAASINIKRYLIKKKQFIEKCY